MTAYRFRMKYDPDPTSHWRDVVVGADRTVDEFQATINRAFGLDQDHLWFVGNDEDYWDSDVKIERTEAYESDLGGGLLGFDEERYDASETTLGELIDRLSLEERDRICYLFDYGDEWRFYGILKEISEDDPDDLEPTIGRAKGEPFDQYARPEMARDLPGRLQALLPTDVVPRSYLRSLEDRDEVVNVLTLHSLASEGGVVTDRCLIQFDDAGYLLEHFPEDWAVVETVDGTGRDAEELLAELVSAAREWHAGIAEIAEDVTGEQFSPETVEAMNAELTEELERVRDGKG